MATNAILGRDVYLALAAVGWADGQLTDKAADAILRAAREEGVAPEALTEIEEATRRHVDLGLVDRVGMSKADRLYVYAVAAWVALLDGYVSAKEQTVLAELGDALGVPAAPRAHADEIMRQIAAEADRPDRFDLVRLRRTLDERLEAARQARLGQLVGDGGASA
jgi:tellurite resistance protein